MKVHRSRYRFAALLTAALFLATSLWLPAAQASMIGTRDFASSEQVETQRQAIVDMLQRDDVRQQLVAWGVNPTEAEVRVGSLTADEVQALHGRMEEMPAGAGVGSVVGAAVFIFIVLLITDILGFTKVFPFTRSQAR